jgi:predicted NAD-dependent protein-ADP-ribosyltransferase YbiA (DUF1768 family)
MAYERLRDWYRNIVSIKNMHRNADGAMPASPIDFRVDRATPLGNPFPMTRDALNVEAITGQPSSNRMDVLNQYKEWFDGISPDSPQARYLDEIYGALKANGHVNLWDWCAPLACHAETIGNSLGDRFVQDLYEHPKAGDTPLVFKGSGSFLSNMYPTQVQVGKAVYDSAEGAFQAGKLKLPGVDSDVKAPLLQKFMDADPYEARRLGRYGLSLTPEQLSEWNAGEESVGDPSSGKFGRMFQVLASKFSDPTLRGMLQDTGDAYLQEGTNILPWGGDENALGRMLMALRELNKR